MLHTNSYTYLDICEHIAKYAYVIICILVLHRTRWIKANGQFYKPLNAVVIGTDEDCPQFGVIQNIYIADCKSLLEVEQYKTLSFLHHYHGYEVKPISQQSSVIDIDNLVSHIPLIISHLSHINKFIVVLKYHICNTMF